MILHKHSAPICVLVVAFGSMASRVGSTQIQTDLAEPSLESLVAHHIEARGGAATWNAVRFISRHQTTAVTVDAAWRRSHGERADQYRIDQGSTEFNHYETQVFDGRSGRIRGDTQDRVLSASEIQELREDAAAFVELFAAKELGLTLRMRGAETYRGAKLWRVEAAFRSGRTMRLYVDSKTWLEVARVRTVFAPDGTGLEVWTELANYRPVSGLWLPHAVNGAPVSYTINAEVGDDLFR